MSFQEHLKFHSQSMVVVWSCPDGLIYSIGQSEWDVNEMVLDRLERSVETLELCVTLRHWFKRVLNGIEL